MKEELNSSFYWSSWGPCALLLSYSDWKGLKPYKHASPSHLTLILSKKGFYNTKDRRIEAHFCHRCLHLLGVARISLDQQQVEQDDEEKGKEP